MDVKLKLLLLFVLLKIKHEFGNIKSTKKLIRVPHNCYFINIR